MNPNRASRRSAPRSIQDLEGFDEVLRKMLDFLPTEQVLSHYTPEQLLAGLSAEQLLAGLPAEQRLAGLDHDHQALALPINVLRLLPEEYLQSLRADVQAELRRRIGAPQGRMELVGSKEAPMSIQEMEGYDELMHRTLDALPPEKVLSHYAPEQRLAGLPAEQRLAGLPAEQRLAGLDHDHQALALPIDVVRLLPEEYLQSLRADVQAELRRRLAATLCG